MRKRKWILLFATALILILGWGWLNWWNEQVPVQIKQITWIVPKDGGWLNECVVDLDNNSDEEVIVSSSKHVWWLRIEGDKWFAEKMPFEPIYLEFWKFEELKTALPVFHHGQLRLLRKRENWIWQKIGTGVRDFIVTDLDGDNRKDDLVVLKIRPKCQVVWFEIDFDGVAHFRDAISLSFKKPSLNYLWLSDESSGQAVEVNSDYTVWAYDGKLKVDKGSWFCLREGLNRDGKLDFVRIKIDRQNPFQIVANLEGQDREVSLTLTKSVFPTLSYLADTDGDGLKEVILWDHFSNLFFRFWVEGQKWQQEVYRFGKEKPEQFAGTIRVGNCDSLVFWSEEHRKLIAVWREREGWKRKTWKFHVTPWSTFDDPKIERDDKGWILVMTKVWLPDYHPFWKRWLPIAERLRRSKVPIPPFLILLPMEKRFRQVWRLDERRLSWKLEQKIHEDDSLLEQTGRIEGRVIAIDLDRDGQKEKLVYEDHTGNWGQLAVKVGKLWKRWRIVPVWEGPHFPTVILNQKEKSWIVSLDHLTPVDSVRGRILRAWSLKN